MSVPQTASDETSPLLKHIGLLLGPFLFALTFFVMPPEGLSAGGWHICGLALWMATWWITEAMPLPVASLLPIIFLPTVMATPLKDVLSPYASPIIFLFLGGFIISNAMEKYNLHMRIGLGVLKLVGVGKKSILGGLMVATAFMGMWMSNTATVIMMLPMAVSIATLLSAHTGTDSSNPFAKAVVLGVAYAAVIGGLGTFVGTPTNAVLYGHIQKSYGIALNLSDWMAFGVPLLLLLLVVTWVLLNHFFLRQAELKPDIRTTVHDEYVLLGRMHRGEKLVALVFTAVALIWIFNKPLEALLHVKLDTAVVAMAGAVTLFLLPINRRCDQFVIAWKDTAKLPWGILIFFGGSLCISDALTSAGVTTWMSEELKMLDGVPLFLLLLVIVGIVILASEMLSNVATITAFLPILTALASSMQIHPFMVLIPATLAASCGFMLPGASAPNALAFSTGFPKVRDMIRTGLLLDLLTAVAVVILTFTLVASVYGIEPGVVPEWAQ